MAMLSINLLKRELLLLLLMFFIGTVLLPAAAYIVGNLVFGEFAGSGFSDFYRTIHSDFRDGQWVVIFLVLSPYLLWQSLRLTLFMLRKASAQG